MKSTRLSKSLAQRIEDLLVYGFLTVASILAAFPLYYTILTSLKIPKDWMAWPPVILPTQITSDNWSWTIWYYGLQPFRNSIIIASLTTVLTVTLGSLAAYGLARFDFRGRDNLAFWILSLRMFPPIAVVVPYFLMFRALGLIDTHMGLIILYTATNLPFFVYMMREFFLELPKDIEEAAMVDGCSVLSAFRHIVIPLSVPGLVALAVFCYIFSWNEFMLASVLTRSEAVTLPLNVAQMQCTRGIEFGYIAVLGTLSILPAMVLAVAIQKYIVRGLTLGAVKG